MKHFTVNVTLCTSEVLTYSNLTMEQVRSLQERIWTHGVKKTLTQLSTELISPLLISRAVVVEQLDLINDQA